MIGKANTRMKTPRLNSLLITMGASVVAVAGLGPAARGADAPNTDPAITVSGFYFGHYHP
jgi:hypothetical protein